MLSTSVKGTRPAQTVCCESSEALLKGIPVAGTASTKPLSRPRLDVFEEL